MTSEGMYSIVIGGSWNKVLVLYTACGGAPKDEILLEIIHRCAGPATAL